MVYKNISGFSDEIDSCIDIQFEVLKKLGITYFEPRGINGKNISVLNPDEALTLRQKADSFGIRASSIGSPVGKIKISDDFDKHFDMFRNVVEIAKILDCRYIRIFSFYCDGSWTDSATCEVYTRLRAMIDYAKRENVVLLHENEKDIYGDTASRCAELMSELYCENFGAVFDPANFVQCGEDTVSAFNLLKNYIKYMHIKDAKANSCEVTPAGYGDGNIEYILKSLFDMGYNGFLSLEPHLGSFEGLAELELSNEMLSLPKSGEGTFTLAYNSLKQILERI